MKLASEPLLSLAIVHEAGSLSGAARMLGKTQPALSMQMRNLAAIVGQPVLARNRRGVALTAVGLELLPHAQAIARAMRSVHSTMDKIAGKEEGTLRIITSTSVAIYCLPGPLGRLKHRFPNLEVQVARQSAENSIEILKQGRAELVVERGPEMTVPPRGFELTRIIEDSTIFAVPPDHPLCKTGRVSVRDIEGLAFVVQEHPSRTRRLVERLFQENGLDFRPTYETVGIEAVKEAVLQGAGTGFLPRVSVNREVQNGELVALELDHVEARRPIFAVHAENKLNSPLCKAFLECL